MQEEIVYLGFVISVDALKMDHKKVKAILEWPTPKNVGQLRSFHDLTSLYIKFINNSSSICNDMTKNTRGY